MIQEQIIGENFTKCCTACGACMNACPTSAITMIEGYNTFLYPQIDSAKCIDCHKCQDICPVNDNDNTNVTPDKMYAFRGNDEVRNKASSGGVFPIIARYFIESGGYVCGAAFDEKMNLRHKIVHTLQELPDLFGSKYVQSEIGFIYQEVAKLLAQDNEVLFVGTPCQVAALKKIVGRNHKKLYSIDILCHGVPSQKIFDLYLSDVSGGRKVVDVQFRRKDAGWTSERIWIKFDDGSIYEKYRRDGDSYVKAFLENFGLRDCCENCPFSEFPRQGDISIGDFWGIDKIDKTQNDGKGTSIVFANNSKGEEIFGILKKNGNVAIYPLDIKIPNRISRHFRHNSEKNRFFTLLNHHSFSEAMDYITKGKYDVGLVCNYYAHNFGGALTQYALSKVLEDMGYTVIMIERPYDSPEKVGTNEKNRLYHHWPFVACAKRYKTRAQMQELNDICDVFVVGSDVLFRHSLWLNTGKIPTLDFVYNYKLKIAYAASYGYDYVLGSEENTAEMSRYMKRFDAFSVREKSGIEFFKNTFGVDAALVLDPVLLCDKKYFQNWIEKTSLKDENEPYISAYILDISREKAEILRKVCEKKQLPAKHIFSVTYTNPTNEYNIYLAADYPFECLKQEDRLKVLAGANFVVADSFHGVCLAIIYNIDFICIVNEERGATRFYSILSLLGLESRMIHVYEDLDGDDKIFEPIDWDKVNTILNEKRHESFMWLKKAMEIEKTPALGFDDTDLILRMCGQLDNIVRENHDLRSLMNLGYYGKTNIYEYLDELNKAKENLIIVISARDTPGMFINRTMADKFMTLGIGENLTDKHWYGYISIIVKGVLVREESRYNKRVEVSYMESDIMIKAISAPLNDGNFSIIEINGNDYSVNSRGLNIVVYDLHHEKIIDSVCFDTHVPEAVCKRIQTAKISP